MDKIKSAKESFSSWYKTVDKTVFWTVVGVCAFILILIVNGAISRKQDEEAEIRALEQRRARTVDAMETVIPSYQVETKTEESFNAHPTYTDAFGWNHIVVGNVKATDVVVLAYYSQGGSVHYSVFEPGKQVASNNWKTQYEVSSCELTFNTEMGECPKGICMIGVYDPSNKTLFYS